MPSALVYHRQPQALTLRLQLAIVLTLLFGMVVLSGCIGQDDEGDFDAKVAIVFGTGGLGDKSFNDAANRGLQWVKDVYNVKGDTVEPVEISELRATEQLSNTDSSDSYVCVALGGGLAAVIAIGGGVFVLRRRRAH